MIMEAELPDGRILEFPEGTDPAVIQATVKRMLGVEEVPPVPEQETIPDTRLPGERRRDRRPAQEPDVPGEEPENQRLGPGTLSVGAFDTGIETPEWLDEMLAGAGRRFSQIGTLGTAEGDPRADELLDESGYATAGGVIADIGTMVAGGGALSRVPGLAVAGSSLLAPKTALQAATAGGAYGAATSPDRVAGGAGGAVGGALGHGIATGIGKIISPKITSTSEEIIEAGGTPTVGDMLGGMTKRLEESATSIPVVGEFVGGAKLRSLEGWGKAQIDKALKTVDFNLPKGAKGREAIELANDSLSNRYTTLLSGMTVKLDDAFLNGMTKIKEAADYLPDNAKRLLNNEVDQKILGPFNNDDLILPGEAFKEMDSALNVASKKFKRSTDPYVAKVGEALNDMHNALLELAKRQNPGSAPKLKALDVAYAKMARINEAAASAGAKEGVFTPNQLKNATRKKTSVKQWASGKGFDQKALEEAVKDLSQSVPDSGTPARLLNSIFLTGGAYAVDPSVAAAIATGAGAYTKAGTAIAKGALGKRPSSARSLRDAIDTIGAPVSGTAGAATGINVAPDQ